MESKKLSIVIIIILIAMISSNLILITLVYTPKIKLKHQLVCLQNGLNCEYRTFYKKGNVDWLPCAEAPYYSQEEEECRKICPIK